MFKLGSLVLVFAAAAAISSTICGCGRATGQDQAPKKSLRKGEAKKALDEFVTLMDGAKAGDISSFNTNFKPTTEIVQRTKDLLVQKQQDEREYLRAIEELKLEETLSLEYLVTESGRDKVLQTVNKAEKIDNDNYAAASKFVLDLSGILEDFGVEVPKDQGALLEKQNQELIASGGKLWEAWRKLVALCESSKPSFVAEALTFDKDEDLDKYSAVVTQLEQASAGFDETMTRIMNERQELMNKSMAQMKSSRDEL